jgi:hypothetical protein
MSVVTRIQVIESSKFATSTLGIPRGKERMAAKHVLTSQAVLKKPGREQTLEPIAKPSELSTTSALMAKLVQPTTPFPQKHDPESVFRYVYSLHQTPATYQVAFFEVPEPIFGDYLTKYAS